MDLFFIHPKITDKDELITMMVKKMEEKGDVTPNYLSSVFDRERATTTCIGRGVADVYKRQMPDILSRFLTRWSRECGADRQQKNCGSEPALPLVPACFPDISER